MAAIKKIMVPTDGSETSKDAIGYAVDMAQAFHASLTLLIVADDQYMDWIGPAYYTTEMMKKIEENSIGQAQRLLDEIDIAPSVGNVTKVVRKGDPVEEIINCAKAEEVDLIVMGTHGRKGFSHMMMGSVAEKVVRLSPCPVLTVKKQK